MKKRIAVLLAALLSLNIFAAGCSQNATAQGDASSGQAISTDGDTVKLLGLADLVPHNELIEQEAPILLEQGIEIEIVSTASDATWNEKVYNGEVDFNFTQHEPYLLEYNETNGTDLVNAGNIHVEPIAAYSNYYDSVDDVPDNAKIVVPNDATNEYRALKILEEAGFIKLRNDLEELKASVDDIDEYIKPIEIVEIDSIQIIGLAPDFDVYITNTNKALEADIDTSAYLFREGADSPYANIITVQSGRENDPAVVALVEALKSDEIQQFIHEHYNGAVLPFED